MTLPSFSISLFVSWSTQADRHAICDSPIRIYRCMQRFTVSVAKLDWFSEVGYSYSMSKTSYFSNKFNFFFVSLCMQLNNPFPK